MFKATYKLSEGHFSVFSEEEKTVSTVSIDNSEKYFITDTLPASIMLILDAKKVATTEEIISLCKKFSKSSVIEDQLKVALKELEEKGLIEKVD